MVRIRAGGGVDRGELVGVVRIRGGGGVDRWELAGVVRIRGGGGGVYGLLCIS